MRINEILSDSLSTDERLLEGIEAVTGGDLTCNCDCGQSESDHPVELCADPAFKLWRDGGKTRELSAWLNAHYPGWDTEGGGLQWGCEKFNG